VKLKNGMKAAKFKLAPKYSENQMQRVKKWSQTLPQIN